MHHGVGIADSALVTAAVYASRYISDRFLPDKAIDLVDEAASALRLAQESKPDELEKLDREIMTLEIERESLRHETDVFSAERRASVEAQLQQKRAEAEQLTAVWQAERARLDKIKETKERLEEAKRELEIAQRQGQYEKASRLRFATIPELEKQLPAEGERGESEDAEGPLAMLHDRVTSADIARVVAKATGIPVQSLLKGEREKLVHVRFPCSYVVSLCEEAYCFLRRWRTRSRSESSVKITSSRLSATPSGFLARAYRRPTALSHPSSSLDQLVSARYVRPTRALNLFIPRCSRKIALDRRRCARR